MQGSHTLVILEPIWALPPSPGRQQEWAAPLHQIWQSSLHEGIDNIHNYQRNYNASFEKKSSFLYDPYLYTIWHDSAAQIWNIMQSIINGVSPHSINSYRRTSYRKYSVLAVWGEYHPQAPHLKDSQCNIIVTKTLLSWVLFLLL